MDILACILKIYPDWKGGVRGNCYEGITPAADETRPIPALQELEAVWPQVEAELEAARQNEVIKARLAELDLKSISLIREWVAKQPDAPQALKDYEAQAQAERAKLIKP